MDFKFLKEFMSDSYAIVLRFFHRINASLTLRTKIASFAPTDYGTLWRLAVEMGYGLNYSTFIDVCRAVPLDGLCSELVRILRTLHTDEDAK